MNVFSQTTPEKNVSERIYYQQLELRHDNDFLHFTDRYYSTGNFISYKRLIKNGKKDHLKRHNSFTLAQEIYTPSDLEETDASKYDRPFAGYLGLNFQHTISSEDWLVDIIYAIGVTGPMSGAEGLQNLFHSTAAPDSRQASWQEQIKNGFTANLYFNYIKEWKLLPKPFSVYFALSPTTAVGTKDIYFQNDIVFYFGKRNELKNTMAYSQLGKLKNEFFFAVRGGYRFVIHDTMLEGNLFGDTSKLLMEPNQNVFIYNVEFYYRVGRNDFKFFYNFLSAETKTTENHMFVTLSLARNY